MIRKSCEAEAIAIVIFDTLKESIRVGSVRFLVHGGLAAPPQVHLLRERHCLYIVAFRRGLAGILARKNGVEMPSNLSDVTC